MVSRLILILSLFFLSISFGGISMAANNGPSIRFVVFHKPGPNWKSGVDFREQADVGQHVAHYKRLYEQGKLHFGGPFLNNSGGMMIPVDGETKESIDKFASEDPAVKSGLLVYEVVPWMIAMEKE